MDTLPAIIKAWLEASIVLPIDYVTESCDRHVERQRQLNPSHR